MLDKKNPQALARFKNVSYTYGAPNLVLKNVSFDIVSGSIIGLLGNNGAGKTTLIRILSGLVFPTKGKSEVFGKNSSDLPTKIKQKIGYASGDITLPNKKISSLLRYVSRFYNCWDNEFVLNCLRLSGVSANSQVNNLSSGQRRLLTIALSLGHHPPLIIWDEPYISLDTETRQSLTSMIIDYRSKYPSSSFLISSHLINDIEAICDRVLVIKQGEIILNEDVTILLPKYKVRQSSSGNVQEKVLENYSDHILLRPLSKSFQFVYETSNLEVEDYFNKINCERIQTRLEDIFCFLVRNHQ